MVVGGGPNGLAAAITLARAGLHVVLLEARETIGGGSRTAELIEPGFRHDSCSAIHPIAAISPFFRSIGLADRWGVEWIGSDTALAHPFDDGSAAVLRRSIDDTARALGADAAAYRDLIAPFLAQPDLFDEILRPIRWPRHPFAMLRFGLAALRSATGLARSRFRERDARGLFAGCGAHAMVPLERAGTASFGIVLALTAHAVGWPCARGGSAAIVEGLARCLADLGGEIRTSHPVASMADLPAARCVLFDLAPRQVAAIARDELPARYRAALLRYRYGPGAFKVDWTLDGPVPWKNAACRDAATLHLGGTLEEVAAAEAAVGRGEHPERPFVLFAQQSVLDPTRAPAGKHTGWAYCHVPNGSSVDMTARIEAQVERFAPGFRDLVRGRHVRSAADLERHNASMVGGDIGGGANDLAQILFRPVARLDPYTTPNPRIFLCSGATPPGGGVHGMCGHNAALSALRHLFGKRGEN